MHGRSVPSIPVVAARYTSPIPPRATSFKTTRRPIRRGRARAGAGEETSLATSPIAWNARCAGGARPSFRAAGPAGHREKVKPQRRRGRRGSRKGSIDSRARPLVPLRFFLFLLALCDSDYGPVRPASVGFPPPAAGGWGP